MIMWFYYWDEWRKAFWSLIDTYPELFAFLHRMYVIQHTLSVQPPGYDLGKNRKKLFFKKLINKFLSREGVQPVNNSAPQADLPEPLPETYPHVDVLFYTFSNRDTCQGVGEKIFRKLREKGSLVSCGYYQNARHRIFLKNEHDGNPVLTFRFFSSTQGVLRFLKLFPIVCFYGLKSRVVSGFIFLHPIKTWINLLKVAATSYCMDQFLEQVSPKVLLSCNEQGGGDASLLFILAKRRGIVTIQYMHAVPTRQFTPFICDEYWSWSAMTTRMMLGDANDVRVINLGSLEHEAIVVDALPPTVDSTNEKRVLFFGQFGMDEHWGIQSVAKGVKLFIEGLAQYPGPVKVRVREHPSTGERERALLEDALQGLSYELSTHDTPLPDDVAWATHTYTVCSNAIFSSFLGGRPGYLLWDSELNDIYGNSFLPDRNIIRSSVQLTESLSASMTKLSAAKTLQQVLGSPGSIERAACRIEELATSC